MQSNKPLLELSARLPPFELVSSVSGYRRATEILRLKKSTAFWRVLICASTEGASIPKRRAVPATRLFCKSFGGRVSEVCTGTPFGGAIVGLSVRGTESVRT